MKKLLLGISLITTGAPMLSADNVTTNSTILTPEQEVAALKAEMTKDCTIEESVVVVLLEGLVYIPEEKATEIAKKDAALYEKMMVAKTDKERAAISNQAIIGYLNALELIDPTTATKIALLKKTGVTLVAVTMLPVDFADLIIKKLGNLGVVFGPSKAEAKPASILNKDKKVTGFYKAGIIFAQGETELNDALIAFVEKQKTPKKKIFTIGFPTEDQKSE